MKSKIRVLSYLQLINLTSKEYDEYLWELQTIYEDIFDNRIDFYSQPFKPQLITKLFEDLSLDKRMTLADGESRFNNIRTLDEFITDCQREGIELKWRKI